MATHFNIWSDRGGGNYGHSPARHLTVLHHYTRDWQVIRQVKATMANHLLAISQYPTITLNTQLVIGQLIRWVKVSMAIGYSRVWKLHPTVEGSHDLLAPHISPPYSVADLVHVSFCQIRIRIQSLRIRIWGWRLYPQCRVAYPEWFFPDPTFRMFRLRLRIRILFLILHERDDCVVNSLFIPEIMTIYTFV